MEDDQKRSAARSETGRIEAFSDGVFAIALTLLVLNLKVPSLDSGQRLLPALLAQWPDYTAYITSFLVIAIMWINHHRMFTLIRRSDDWLMAFNCLLLLGVCVVPFITALLADFLGEVDGPLATQIYTFTFVVISVFFNLIWRYAAYKNRLLDPSFDPAIARTISRSFTFGPVLYLAAFGLAFISVPASIGITIFLALYFFLPLNVLRKLIKS